MNNTNSQTTKEKVREQRLKFLDEELRKMDFGEPCSKEGILFNIGQLVLELYNYKKSYGNLILMEDS